MGLFISYSHKDEQHRNRLESHLTILKRTGLIAPWHDRKIEAGDDWKREIHTNLEAADIFLLLVSANSIRSDYCWEYEMEAALKRHAENKVRVIPVIVSHCVWQKPPLDGLSALPRDGKAVASRHWKNHDEAWTNVTEGIERVAAEVRKKR